MWHIHLETLLRVDGRKKVVQGVYQIASIWVEWRSLSLISSNFLFSESIELLKISKIFKIAHSQMTFNSMDQNYKLYNLAMKAINFHVINSMPTSGSIVVPRQQEGSLMIGKVHLSPQYIAISEDFFHPTRNNLSRCNMLQFCPCTSLHARQKLLSKWKLSRCCGAVASPGVGMLQVTLFQVSQNKTKS